MSNSPVPNRQSPVPNPQKLIRAVEEADSSSKLLDAVEELSAACLPEAIPILIAALGYNNPGAAVAAVDGLVQLGEPAVKPLLQLIDDHNYTARAWAIRALAGIGDPRGLDTLLDAAKNDFALSVRRAAARGLGTVKWEEIASERLVSAQESALEALLIVCQDPEWIVRYAAVTGLENLAKAVTETETEFYSKIVVKLEEMATKDEEIAVCSRVELARERLVGHFN
ncbi:MAG: HEAT repeat domain-containing protein [Mastigocoleus sp. MO_167.B18]|nr:HEAT repeat domain-containing protein [Mastigocoleus sp. MO_167.B18]